MATKNRVGNVVSFFISLALHLGAVYLAYTISAEKDETLLAEKDETLKMMTISLNQISPNINDKNSMQATQEVAPQPLIQPEPEAEPKPQPPKEEPKPEPEKPKTEKPKPKPKKAEKVAQERPKEEPLKEQTEEQNKPVTPALAPPSSQNVANNEAVSQGGAPQSGQSKGDENAQARTILGEIHAAILKHKTYPKRAINSKMEGRAQVGFLLSAQCEFENLEILKGSGHDFLDRHALIIVKKACKDFPEKAIGMNLKVIIAFNLKDVE